MKKTLLIVSCFVIFSVTHLLAQVNPVTPPPPPNVLPVPIASYRQAVAANGLLFISGQIALDPQTKEMFRGDIREEVRRVMQNLDAVLNANGSNFTSIVKCTVYLVDMNDFDAFNEVYSTFFPKEKYPARETVQVIRLPKEARIEISAVATLKK